MNLKNALYCCMYDLDKLQSLRLQHLRRKMLAFDFVSTHRQREREMHTNSLDRLRMEMNGCTSLRLPSDTLSCSSSKSNSVIDREYTIVRVAFSPLNICAQMEEIFPGIPIQSITELQISCGASVVFFCVSQHIKTPFEQTIDIKLFVIETIKIFSRERFPLFRDIFPLIYLFINIYSLWQSHAICISSRQNN